MVRIQNEEWEADGLGYRETVGEQAAYFAHTSEQFDPTRDLSIAEVDGRMVGFARRDWVDANDGVREYRSRCAVDPAWRRRGIGTAMLADGERQQTALASTHDTSRPRVLGTFTEGRNEGANAIARRAGYEPVRWFFDMTRSGLQDNLPAVLPMPDGIEVRPVQAEQLIADLARRPRGVPRPLGRRRRVGARPSAVTRTRPTSIRRSGSSPGMATRSPAAVVNTIYAHENEATGSRRGWLDSVFTRRAWRKRGVASALIARSLHLLAERGMDTAMLGVDADNPSGALRLYESFGFVVTDRGQAWRKPMEEGPFT